MQRLDDTELSKPPSEVLEIICKLGKGSYGSVYKARYKANGGIVAVKKVCNSLLNKRLLYNIYYISINLHTYIQIRVRFRFLLTDSLYH